jgi:hypothetical protein
MEKQAVIRESVVGTWAGNIYWTGNNRLPIVGNVAYLHSFNVDNLKYIHSYAFGYDKCKFNSALEAALMIKSTIGEKME